MSVNRHEVLTFRHYTYRLTDFMVMPPEKRMVSLMRFTQSSDPALGVAPSLPPVSVCVV